MIEEFGEDLKLHWNLTITKQNEVLCSVWTNNMLTEGG